MQASTVMAGCAINFSYLHLIGCNQTLLPNSISERL